MRGLKHNESGAARSVRPPVGALAHRLSTKGSSANSSVMTAAVRRMDGGADLAVHKAVNIRFRRQTSSSGVVGNEMSNGGPDYSLVNGSV